MADLDDGFDFDDTATVVDMGVGGTVELPPYPALAQFGPFEILGRIARGGMAEVYLAREPQPSGKPRHVVLKRILPEREDDADFIQMFLDEGGIATRLYHPNICHVYEVGELEGTTFMTLEFVYGVTLRKMLRRAGRSKLVPPRIAAYIVAKVAAALDYVHEAKGVHGRPLNIIHRDVSPHNIMIGWDGRVKLLDFGIAKTSSDEEEAGVLKGKHAYLSPEQARGKALDGRSDLFSLGICFFESMTSKPLYHREGMLPTLEAIVRDPVPSAREKNPAIPEELDALVMRALAKRPSDRFQTGSEFEDALNDFLWRSGGVVSPLDVAAVLDEMFPKEERNALKENSAKLTGSFHSLTGSIPSLMSGSFGPFGSDPGRPKDEGPDADITGNDIDTVPPPEKKRPLAAASGMLDRIPLWVIAVLVAICALLIGGLIAVLTRSVN